jgi:hypothetical protein
MRRGVIERAAADGSGPPEGTRVVGLVDSGAWARFAAIPTNRLTAVPDEVSDAQAATLPTAGLTALRALQLGGLVLGKRVLITGANGGVGRIAIQLARESGASVTGLVRDAAASQELLRGLGAAEVVETISGDFDLIVEGVGGATFGDAIEHLAPRGIVVNIATPSDDETVTFHAARFDRAKGARIYTLNLASARWWPTGDWRARSSSKPPGARLPGRSTLCSSAASVARRCSTSTDTRTVVERATRCCRCRHHVDHTRTAHTHAHTSLPGAAGRSRSQSVRSAAKCLLQPVTPSRSRLCRTGLSRRRSRIRSHHRDHTTASADKFGPKRTRIALQRRQVNHAWRMSVRNGLEEPVNRLNKPLLRTHDALVGGPYIPMA